MALGIVAALLVLLFFGLKDSPSTFFGLSRSSFSFSGWSASPEAGGDHWTPGLVWALNCIVCSPPMTISAPSGLS